jgi:hypothetical protein
MVTAIAIERLNAYETAIKTVEIEWRFRALVFLPCRNRYNAMSDYYNVLMRGAL